MIVQVKELEVSFGENVILDKINFHINKGEIFGVIGKSGSGKTVLFKQMLLLQRPKSGQIIMFGKDILSLKPKEEEELKKKWGVLFQFGALFSSNTILENVMAPIKEYTKLPKWFIKNLAMLKINMTGLSPDTVHLFPAQISGGMKKRAALARAMALDPEILFLDEPTSGLDPISARNFDNLILKLRELLGITIVMITHDKDTIKNVLDRFIVLGDKKILMEGNFENLIEKNPKLLEIFPE
jgi:phospholipid/cholesterol/gamma-HCH transport system ATP-binding protein